VQEVREGGRGSTEWYGWFTRHLFNLI
jgi:hypothetical protein